MKKKQFYESPEAEMLVVRFEQNIMSPTNSWDKPATGGSTWGGGEDEDNGME